jgi:hypothetical protein
MYKVKHVRAVNDYRLSVEFEDGVRGIVELRDRLFGPVFEPLLDEAAFQQVGLDEFGVVCWPNGADLAPDALYERVRSVAEPSTARG